MTAEKEKVNYCHKPVDELLEHEIPGLLDADFAKQLTSVDMVVGGDHGKGKFRMVLMVLLRTNDTSKTRRRSFVVGECLKRHLFKSRSFGTHWVSAILRSSMHL